MTLLFGVGWHAPHRVVPNGATEKWCAADPLGPRWVRELNRALEPLARRVPKAKRWALRAQGPGFPFYTPAPLLEGMDARLVDATPLYAGTCVAHIRSVLPAADIVRELARGADEPL